MFVRIVTIFTVLFFIGPAFADDNKLTRFLNSDENSRLTVNHAHVNYVFGRIVLDLGPSDRSRSSDTVARTGTRLRAKRNRLTYLEGARIPFQHLHLSRNLKKIRYLRELLQDFPDKAPLYGFTKNDQIAYWLNLYNVALIEKMTTQSIFKLERTLYGEENILDEKFITVAGMNISLNDIQFNIVYKIEAQINPLLMYGFFQGVIGSPKVRTKAYSAKTLYNQLSDNAEEFVNSNRGTYWAKEMKVSWYYEHNQILFPDFQTDLKKHLMQYITEPMKSRLVMADNLQPELTSFNRADLLGGEKQYGTGNKLTVTHPDEFNKEIYDLELIREMRKKYRRMRPTVTIEDVTEEDVKK